MPPGAVSSPALGSLLISPLVLSAVWITLALAELSRSRLLKTAAWAYNWFFQGTPLLMQLIFFWAVLPMLGLKLPLILAGLVGLALNEAARMSQIIRAAIIGVDARQFEAARNLGLSRWQVLRLVTAPQALRIALPPTGNE